MSNTQFFQHSEENNESEKFLERELKYTLSYNDGWKWNHTDITRQQQAIVYDNTEVNN